MRLTPDGAYFIYARACRKWYGKRALKIARKQIRGLEERGDATGVHAWTKVADLLRRHDEGSEVLKPFDFPAPRRRVAKPSRKQPLDTLTGT